MILLRSDDRLKLRTEQTRTHCLRFLLVVKMVPVEVRKRRVSQTVSVQEPVLTRVIVWTLCQRCWLAISGLFVVKRLRIHKMIRKLDLGGMSRLVLGRNESADVLLNSFRLESTVRDKRGVQDILAVGELST